MITKKFICRSDCIHSHFSKSDFDCYPDYNLSCFGCKYFAPYYPLFD